MQQLQNMRCCLPHPGTVPAALQLVQGAGAACHKDELLRRRAAASQVVKCCHTGMLQQLAAAAAARALQQQRDGASLNYADAGGWSNACHVAQARRCFMLHLYMLPAAQLAGENLDGSSCSDGYRSSLATRG